MAQKIEQLLRLMGDMQKFPTEDDPLTALVREHEADEIDEADLFFVAAASQTPDYESFLKRAKKDR